METVILVVHLMLAIVLVGTVLLQKSEGGALGMGGGGMSGFMSGRSTANLLTRTTAILAACFMLTSITLVLLAGRSHSVRSLIDQSAPAGSTAPSAPTSLPPLAPPSLALPAAPAPPAAPAAPAVPSAPTK